MANSLSLGINATFIRGTEQIPLNTPPLTVPVAGTYAIRNTQNIGTSDETLDLGDVATPGYVRFQNLAAYVEVTTPAAPTVTNQGTPGATTVTYKIVAKQSDGSYSAASSAGTTTTAAATLNGTNFNRLTWAAVAGADSYDIYRTAAGGTPSTTGKIGNTTALTFDDTGLAGDAGTAPATGVDNVILIGANGTSYPIKLKGEEIALLRFNGAAIHAKANTIAADLDYGLFSD